MQEFNGSEQMAAQHERLHIVEQWSDGPRKQAALGAIQSALDSLSRHPAMQEPAFVCILCQSRSANVIVLEATESRVRASVDDPAAWKRAS